MYSSTIEPCIMMGHVKDDSIDSTIIAYFTCRGQGANPTATPNSAMLKIRRLRVNKVSSQALCRATIRQCRRQDRQFELEANLPTTIPSWCLFAVIGTTSSAIRHIDSTQCHEYAETLWRCLETIWGRFEYLECHEVRAKCQVRNQLI
jgi:hypothetical protein